MSRFLLAKTVIALLTASLLSGCEPVVINIYATINTNSSIEAVVDALVNSQSDIDATVNLSR